MSKLRAFFELIKKDKGLLEQTKKLVSEQKAHGKVLERPKVPVLQDDPEFQQLSKERDAALDRLAELQSKVDEKQSSKEVPQKDKKEIAEARAKVEELDHRIDALSSEFSKAGGAVPKPLGAEYARENQRMGWRFGEGKEEPDALPGQTDEVRKKQVEAYQKVRESDRHRSKTGPIALVRRRKDRG